MCIVCSSRLCKIQFSWFRLRTECCSDYLWVFFVWHFQKLYRTSGEQTIELMSESGAGPYHNSLLFALLALSARAYIHTKTVPTVLITAYPLKPTHCSDLSTKAMAYRKWPRTPAHKNIMLLSMRLYEEANIECHPPGRVWGVPKVYAGVLGNEVFPKEKIPHPSPHTRHPSIPRSFTDRVPVELLME